MSKANKWAGRNVGSAPSTEVARDAVKSRLAAVSRFARLAVKKAEQDVEYVHQLRVSVRRANAALELYSPFLPPSKTRKIGKELKAFRRAAGPARELDVLAERLTNSVSLLQSAGAQQFRRLVRDQRSQAQRTLKRGCGKSERARFKKSAAKLVAKMKWRSGADEPMFGGFAREALRRFLDRFFTAAGEDLGDIQALHRMRIEGKTVRYAMELLSPAFDKSFRKQIYPVFECVQDKLGAINDHASAIDFYRGMYEKTKQNDCRDIIQHLIEQEETELEAARNTFMDWWTPERMAEMKQQFDSLLQPLDTEQESAGIIGSSSSPHR